jgi:hemerythrin-like domain-containing protein
MDEPRFELPPLKRHAALQPLSREHMGGLVQARNLQRSASGDEEVRRRAVEAFVRVWREEISHHFDDEERLLLPLTRSGELRERLLGEHRVLREMAARCEEDPGGAAGEPAFLLRLSTLLHDHIRWEEREYFEAVQRDFPERLAGLMDEAAAIERERPGARPRHALDEGIAT